MVSIREQEPIKSVKISVVDSQNTVNINSRLLSGGNLISASDNTDELAVGLARDWAIKTDGKVNNEEYSAKYYAQLALKQIQSNWNENDTTSAGYIQNKPDFSSKQDILVSGTNIKTINGASVIGAGNLSISELPSQTGNNGKFLSTDGVNATWNTISMPDISNLANKDLSNLTASGEERFYALKGYNESGKLLTDLNGLTDVKFYAHSTFDLSKFTVVGSPVITDDGIASGFSNSNYVYITGLSFGSLAWEIEDKFIFASSANNQALVSGGSTNASAPLLYINSTGMQLNIPSAVGTWGWQLLNAAYTFTAGNAYWYKIGWTGTDYYIKVSDDGNTYSLLQTKQGTAMFGGSGSFDLYIGANIAQASRYTVGSIDLKGVNIKAGGVPVFSGNKTGIDTIKSDGYTEAGTVTFTPDGIASGFSASNYLTKSLTFTPQKSVKYTCKFTTGSDINSTQTVFRFYNNLTGSFSTNSVQVRENKIRLIVADFDYGDYSCTANTTYFAEVECTTSASWGKLYDANMNLLYTYNNQRTPIVMQGSDSLFTIGVAYFNNAYIQPFLGSIDLSALRIYVDGDLIYQPCLKIPYTESKTGSKIVDSFYRDRVVNMYEQFGSAPYYTLSDTDFMLPMGEIYGFIGKTQQNIDNILHITETYINGSSWYRVWSDGWIEQGGINNTLESTWNIVLLKTMTNTDYNVSAIARYASAPDSATVALGASSKTTSGFTVKSTVNWGGGIEWRVCGY